MLKPSTLRRTLLSTIVGLPLLFALCLSAGAAAALGATSTDLPLYFLRSADCTDEIVEISGTVHLVHQFQADGSEVGHFNYQNVMGLGLTSGTIYQTSAVDQVRLTAPFPTDITLVQSFHLIGRGTGTNLLVKALYHVTVDGNGQFNVTMDDLSIQCK